MKVKGPVWTAMAWHFGDVPVTCEWSEAPDSDSGELTMVLEIMVEANCTSAAFRYARQEFFKDLRSRGYDKLCNMMAVVRG